jgi:hypothetical protein
MAGIIPSGAKGICDSAPAMGTHGKAREA